MNTMASNYLTLLSRRTVEAAAARCDRRAATWLFQVLAMAEAFSIDPGAAECVDAAAVLLTNKFYCSGGVIDRAAATAFAEA